MVKILRRNYHWPEPVPGVSCPVLSRERGSHQPISEMRTLRTEHTHSAVKQCVKPSPEPATPAIVPPARSPFLSAMEPRHSNLQVLGTQGVGFSPSPITSPGVQPTLTPRYSQARSSAVTPCKCQYQEDRAITFHL